MVRVRTRSFVRGSDRVKVVCVILCLVGFIYIVCIMSWQDYVDKQLLASRCVTKAAIAGHDGNVWAKSDGFEVSKEEIAKLVQGFEKQDILTSSGVTLAGNRYIYLSGTDRVIRAKLGKVGVHCMKTQQAVVVSLYEDPIQPQQAASVVEKLGDYLVSCGY